MSISVDILRKKVIMEVQAIVVDESETRVPTCVVFTDRLVTYVFIAFVLYYGYP